MQAQWPPAPYVGIWTRTTSFRREALERALANGTVVKATVMRQTLHLVTLRDYALFRAAMSETNFPWETSQAKLLASSVRALAADAPGDIGGGARPCRARARAHGTAGATCLAQRAGARPSRAPPRDRSLARAARRSVRRAGGAGDARSDRGACRDASALPRGVRAGVAPRSRAVEHDARARDLAGARSARAAAPVPRRAGPRAPRRPARRRCPMPRRLRRFASCRSGTTSSSRSRTGRVYCPRPTGRRSSA